MKRVYVAGKINDEACGYIKNLHDMFSVAEKVRRAGFAVFVPGLDLLMGLVHGDWTYRDYFENSQPWLDASDIMFVSPNWRSSTGTKREIKRAKRKNIPVYYDLKDMIAKER